MPTRNLDFNRALGIFRAARSRLFKAPHSNRNSEGASVTKPKLGFRGPACLALLLFPCIAHAQAAFDVSSVARPGDAAAVAAELGSVSSPSLSDRGEVAFEADGAVFLHSKGTTRVVAAFGDPAPGAGTFTSARLPSLNGQGQVAFLAQVDPADRSGIFLFNGDAITQVVSTNDFSPEGGRFIAFYEVALNDAGQIALHAFATTGEGIFLASPGAITTLALTGQPAPGGGIFGALTSPAINASGQVVFSAPGTGIFLAVDGTLTRVARVGDPAPGGEGATFVSLQYPASISDAGEVVFDAYASPPGRGGIYLFSGGQIVRVIAGGDPAPEEETFGAVAHPSVNASGQIAFHGNVSGGRGSGAYLLSKGSVTRVMRPLQPSPEGDVFTQARDSVLNNMGQVAFIGSLANHVGGIYLYSDGMITRVAGQGDAIGREPRFASASGLTIDAAGQVAFSGETFPGGHALFDEAHNPIAHPGDPAPEGGVFTSVSLPTGNDRGDIVFLAANSNGHTTAYLSSEGSLKRIVGTGDPAPQGETFQAFYFSSLNNEGEIAFVGAVSPSNRYGIYVGSAEFRGIVSTGDPAPGGGTFTLFQSVSLNDSGQVLFSASVAVPSRSGIFLWSDGSVRAIAQAGNGAPGGGTFLSVSQPSLNASGQVAFHGSLFRSSGIFLSSGGVVTSIARSGDPAPGGTISAVACPSLNDAGQVALLATVGGRAGIYLSSEGALNTIVRQGDPAPGGSIFTSFRSPRLNARSQVAFMGVVSGSTGVFLATP